MKKMRETKKTDYIYTLTTIKFGMEEVSRGPHKGKKILQIVDDRTVGWFSNLKTAIKCAEENWGDIYENGSYPYIVIEKVSKGLYPICTEEIWYKWQAQDGKYRLCEKPTEYKHVINFSMG